MPKDTAEPLRTGPPCQRGDDRSCPSCATALRPVQDGQGEGRYDCSSCDLRFDLSRLSPSLETEGLTHPVRGKEGLHGIRSATEVLERRNRCGKTGMKLRCANCDAFTYVPLRCGTRICQDCARVQADRMYFDVRKKIQGLEKRRGYRLRHVVLTVKGSGQWNKAEIEQSLSRVAKAVPVFYRDYLRREPMSNEERERFGLKPDDLVADLSLWRKRSVLKDASRRSITKTGKERVLDLTGLVAAFEVGPNGNVHVHCLYYGPFRRQEEMSAVWRKITGDSFIVWVRPIENQEKALREITKYVVKLSEFDDGQLVELHHLLEPYRRIRTYGAFLGVKKEDARPECWSCRESGQWKVEERDIPEDRWLLEYLDWKRYKSSGGADSRALQAVGFEVAY